MVVDRTDPMNRLSHRLREMQVELLAISKPILRCIHLRTFENSSEALPDVIVSVHHCLEASAKSQLELKHRCARILLTRLSLLRRRRRSSPRKNSRLFRCRFGFTPGWGFRLHCRRRITSMKTSRSRISKE